jgi:enterochelin esterase-like enzyme
MLPALVFALWLGTAAAGPVKVELGTNFREPATGRLLVFAEPLERARLAAAGHVIESVDADLSNPKAVTAAAVEIELKPGESVEIGPDTRIFPKPFSSLPPGRYVFQAVLDRRHSYAYSGRGAGDLVSAVTELSLPAGGTLRLAHALLDSDPTAATPDMTDAQRAELKSVIAHTQRIAFQSRALTRYLQRPAEIRGWVLLPPGYETGSTRFPTVFYTHGFGDDSSGLLGAAIYMDQAMVSGRAPRMIWVYLDESSPFGTHEFADSATDGPWGRALTQELIPSLERRYRMQATAQTRFLNGHSSGGWATLWLQTHYPALFGGTWSTSPDPADFHDFFQADLYDPHTNMYRKADGSERPALRDHGKVLATFRDITLLGAVLGAYGDQITSFEAVFSPRGNNGKPMPLFDRDSGALYPEVAAYWCANYDIAHYVAANWRSLKSDLDGKIHVIVGTEDSYYLDGPARELEAALKSVGAKSDFRYLPGRDHNDVYQKGDDDEALLLDIAWEMYRTAQRAPPQAAATSR